VQTIADTIGKTRPKTVQILKELVDAGWLQRAKRMRDSGGNTSSEYIVRLDGGTVEKKRAVKENEE
jgi:predicted transcriptional regulator